MEEFQPSRPVAGHEVLELAGTRYPVTLNYKDDKRNLIVKVDQGDSSLDREEYEESPALFSLLEAQDTDYYPALPLIRFPMDPGDDWRWKGTTTSFGRSQSASAQVSSRKDQLVFGKSVHNVVRIDVSLTLDGFANSTPSLRRLTFWFEPGHGLLKRDFGGTSIRELVVP